MIGASDELFSAFADHCAAGGDGHEDLPERLLLVSVELIQRKLRVLLLLNAASSCAEVDLFISTDRRLRATASAMLYRSSIAAGDRGALTATM